MQLVVILSFFAVVIAFAFAVYLYLWVKKQPSENKRIIEVSSLIQQMEDAESKTLAGMTFYHGTLWNQQAVVVKSGVGKVNMAVCTQILVDVYEVDMVINLGWVKDGDMKLDL